MSTININDLMPNGKRIRKIHSGSELLLAYELDKYAKENLNLALSLEGVSIAKELLSKEYFSFVVNNGLNVGIDVDKQSLADYSLDKSAFFTDFIKDVEFAKVEEGRVTYTFDKNTSLHAVMNQESKPKSYISLVAKIWVDAYQRGENPPVLVIDHSRNSAREFEYADVRVLIMHGNELFKDYVELNVSEDTGIQPEWETYLTYKRQLGKMDREYSVDEKKKNFKRNFEVGDAVLLYKRKRLSAGKSVGKLNACFPAVIESITDKHITIKYFPQVQTPITQYVEVSEREMDLEDYGTSHGISNEDYTKFTSMRESVFISDLGIGDTTFKEERFILEPTPDDSTMQYVRTGVGESTTAPMVMNALETIYAVFETRGIQYNRQRFIDKYFKGKEPLEGVVLN